MDGQQKGGPRRTSLPHIPSNLRIRRPRDAARSTVVARDTLPDESPDQRVIFEDGLAPPPSLSSLARRSSGARRRGVVESMAMNDRITNAAQRPGNNVDAGGVDDASASNSTSTASRSQPNGSTRERPRLLTRASDNRLPAVTEVVSPTEPGGDESPRGTRRMMNEGPSHGAQSAFETADDQAQAPRTEYFDLGAPNESDGRDGELQPSSSALRPVLSSSVSMPPGRGSSPIEGSQLGPEKGGSARDDTVVADGGGRLARRPSNISIPTPLTEENESFDDDHHAAEVADYLDVIDAEVGALSYLTNIQNSIFVPNIPALYDRRPVHELPRSRRRSATITSLAKRGARRASATESQSHRASLSRTSQDRHSITSDLEQGRASALEAATGFTGGEKAQRMQSRRSVLTRMTSAVGLSRKPQDEEEKEYEKHIKEWREMDDEERDELDEHVRLVLSKRSKFRRGLKGFYAFVKTPMGFIMTLYGFLITFWGTAIMLFIWNWIKVGERKRYWIEICDQILCALFAAVGLGFAPFRAVDTYRMIWIAKMHYRTWERREALGLNDLPDPNDLPRPEVDGRNQVRRVGTDGREISSQEGSQLADTDMEMTAGGISSPTQKPKHWWDLKHDSSPGRRNLLSPQDSHASMDSEARKKSKEAQFIVPDCPQEDPSGKTGDLRQVGRPHPELKRHESLQSELVKEREDIVVLTPEEQAILEHHQRKFHQSHSFYRFHETATHRAFPLDLMITIVCLLDCHSILQGALGGCTWGIKYTHRPTALTATLITCSLSCNAVAGLLIYIGGRKTKKREEVERRLRIALEAMALAKIERRRARGELPERQAHHSKGSGSPTAEGEASDESTDGQQQSELRQAVDVTARQTEEQDQAQYDEPISAQKEQERRTSLRDPDKTQAVTHILQP